MRRCVMDGKRVRGSGFGIQGSGFRSKVQGPRRLVLSPRLNSAGFTLIEIMVVVFILGLLVTMVAPKIMGRTDEAKRTKAAADVRAIQQALNLYKLDNGRYP